MKTIADSVTDGQFTAMTQAAGRSDKAPWRGEMGPALECCDRGWMEARRLGGFSPDDHEGVFYVITSNGAAVLQRETIRRGA